jgi:hypothetical protein
MDPAGIPEPPRPSSLGRPPRVVHRAMRLAGWTELEAASLAAYALGLPIYSSKQPLCWTLREIEHLQALREMCRLGLVPG